MYHVEISNNGTSRFDVKAKDYEFVIDAKGAGVTPPDALLASLGSCIGVYLRKYAEGAGLGLEKFKISVDAEFESSGGVCFRQINVRIDLCGENIDERRKKAMMAFIKNCPVHNTLDAKPNIDIDIL